MWETSGKTDMSYMKDSCYSEESIGRHPLFIAFDLLVVISFFISFLVIIYMNDGKEPTNQQPGFTAFKSVSAHPSDGRTVRFRTAKSRFHLRVAFKKRERSKKLSGKNSRKLTSLGLNRKIEVPTDPFAHTFFPLTDSPGSADRHEQATSAAFDGSLPSEKIAAVSHPDSAEESGPSTLIIDFYEPIDMDEGPGNALHNEQDTSTALDASGAPIKIVALFENSNLDEEPAPSTFIIDFYEPIDLDEKSDIASIADPKDSSHSVDTVEPSEEPQAEAVNAGDMPSHSTETDVLETPSPENNENLPAPSTEVIQNVNNHRFSVVDGMIDPFRISAGNLTGRRRQSTAFSRFPDLELNHERSTAAEKRPAGRTSPRPFPANTPSTGTPPLGEEEIESNNDHENRRTVTPSALNGPSTTTVPVDSRISPQSKKPLGMNIVVPQAEEPSMENQEPPVTPSENNTDPRRQSRILKFMGYVDGKPKIAKTPWTPGGSERSKQDGSLPATPRTPFKGSDRKASLINSGSLTSSPISPANMSKLSWTTSRMRSQTRDQPNTPNSVQDARNTELFRRFERKSSLLFSIGENSSMTSQTAPSTPQEPAQSSTMGDTEGLPSSPTPAPRATQRPATAGGPPPSFSTLGRGQVPAYWEPFWASKDKPQKKEGNGK